MSTEVLDCELTRAAAPLIRKLATREFVTVYQREKDRHDPEFQWGDETEYMVVAFNDATETAKAALKAPEILKQLNFLAVDGSGDEPAGLFCSETLNYMIEGIPFKPYGHETSDYENVEKNMRLRRAQAQSVLDSNEAILTITSFPRLGCRDFCIPYDIPTAENTEVTGSVFLTDNIVSSLQPLYHNAFKLQRMALGRQPVVNIPVLQDTCTLKINNEFLTETPKEALENHIYLDSTGFGFGCCSLQVTLKAFSLSEARILHDQFAALCPLLLALTAAAPLHRGLISDVDCRWPLITKFTLWHKTTDSNNILQKTRCDSVSCYISPEAEKFNDVPVTVDNECFEELLEAGVDMALARFVACMLKWEPFVLPKDLLHETSFPSNIEHLTQSNWPSVRLKMPFRKDDPGWRVEIRPCEVQLTDQENAAVACFIALLSRVIAAKKLNSLMPISKVDENFQRATRRNALQNEKFWFNCGKDGTLVELTADEIFNGKKDGFSGLVPLIRSHMKECGMNSEIIDKHMKLISRRAAGQLLTDAQWIRSFVVNHPDYKNDSVVSEKINYDLLKTVDRIQKGEIKCPEILG